MMLKNKPLKNHLLVPISPYDKIPSLQLFNEYKELEHVIFCFMDMGIPLRIKNIKPILDSIHCQLSTITPDIVNLDRVSFCVQSELPNLSNIVWSLLEVTPANELDFNIQFKSNLENRQKLFIANLLKPILTTATVLLIGVEYLSIPLVKLEHISFLIQRLNLNHGVLLNFPKHWPKTNNIPQLSKDSGDPNWTQNNTLDILNKGKSYIKHNLSLNYRILESLSHF